MIDTPDIRRKLHIAIFADERSIHTRRWALGMRGLGHRVDLITLRKDKDHDIGGIDLGAHNKAGYLLKLGKLRRFIEQLRPDIFHAHYASSYGFLASFISHPAKFLSVWGDDIVIFPKRNFLFRKMVQRSLSSPRLITVTSEYLRKVVLAYRDTAGRVKVVPFGVDVNEFAYIERDAGKEIRIGIAKHLEPYYGIDSLLKAFGILASKRRNVRLLIAGSGSREGEYKRLVSRFGLNKIVDFAGYIEHSKMPEFLGSLDIAAMPSSSEAESFGVAALEASATGLPVVATNVGGIQEVVVDGITGFLAEKKNAEEIAGYLDRLVCDPGLRQQMGRSGREMVETRFNWQDNLIAMQNLYYEMIES